MVDRNKQCTLSKKKKKKPPTFNWVLLITKEKFGQSKETLVILYISSYCLF